MIHRKFVEKKGLPYTKRTWQPFFYFIGECFYEIKNTLGEFHRPERNYTVKAACRSYLHSIKPAIFSTACSIKEETGMSCVPTT